MKRGLVSLGALSLFCIGFSLDGSGDLLATPGQAHTEQTNHGWFSGYIQSQYFSTDRATASSGFFRNRRVRLAYNHMGDEKTMVRLSIEFAAGTNHNTSQVRDGFVQYRPNTFKSSSGPVFTFGAQNMPMGYDISYSSGQRYWPEQSIYEQAFFNGEDGNGFQYQNGSDSNYWYVAAFDSLTVNDPEKADSATKGEITPVAGVHLKHGAWEGGISGMTGKRPSYSAGAVNLASTDRRFAYFDLRYHPQNSRFDVRSEYMVGKDRIPLAAVAAGNKTTGGHVNVDYKLSDSDTAVLRYETFDRNTDNAGDLQTLYGVAYAKDVNKFLRVTFATDWNKNPTLPAGQTSFRTFTLRVQFKF